MTWLAAHPILAVIFFLAFLIFVHETGHFIVGKLCGIGVEIYSIGFGPTLFGFNRKGTEYRLSALPLGGFVKFAGTIPSEEVPEYFKGMEMHNAPVWARFLTILAGPAMNLLLAAVIFTAHAHQGIEHPASIVGTVMPSGPAEKAGIFAGDKIVALNGEKVFSWNDLRDSIAKSPGKELELSVERFGQIETVKLTPEAYEGESFTGEKVTQGRIGISYGLVPPIVSKEQDLDRQSSASMAGLSTGDRVHALSFVNSEGVLVSEPIETWPSFLLHLEDAYDARVSEIELTVTSSKLLSGALASQEKRKLVLKTEKWSDLNFSPQIGRISKQTLLAKSLGLVDSQLTLAEVRDPLKGTVKKGDRILSLGGKKVNDVFSLSKVFQKNKESEIELEVLRDDKIFAMKVPLKPVEVQKAAGKEIYYQFNAAFLGQSKAPEPYIEKYDSILSSMTYGFKETAEKSMMIVHAIWGLISGKLPLKTLGGPMLIAKIAGDAAEAGWFVFFTTMALISINLGILNLFPIPALDGGQIILVLAEGVRGRPLSEVAIENFQRVGFVMIMALFVLATYNDLSRFWTSMLRGMTGMFE